MQLWSLFTITHAQYGPSKIYKLEAKRTYSNTRLASYAKTVSVVL